MVVSPHHNKRAARAAAVCGIVFCAAVGGAWSAPRVSDAVAAWLHSPPVRGHTLTLAGGLIVQPPPGAAASALGAPSAAQHPASVSGAGPRVLDAGMRFTMLGLTCDVPARPGGVLIRLRTSEDGESWSTWYTVPLEVSADGSRTPQAFTEPLWTGAGRYVQVKALAAGAGAPLRLRQARLVAINSTEDADGAAVVLGILRRVACAVAGYRLTPAAGAMTGKPRIVTRGEWGANESLRGGTPSYAPVTMAFVHHTDSGNHYSRSQAPAIVRGVYYYHTRSLHWSDVGYNFLVDRYGTVYEGRYGGMTKGVIGAQVLGFNTGSTGVSVIGTFTDATPPRAAMAALRRLLAWKLDVHHVDPLGHARLVCAYGEKFKTGERVMFPTVAGHRQANYTDCPGGRLYALLPGVRKAVAGMGLPKIYDFSVRHAAISPDGDGVQDAGVVRFTVSQAADWRIEIRTAGGALVRHVTGRGSAATMTWAGRGDDGSLLPDGDYKLTASAAVGAREARPASAELRIDTVAPRLHDVLVSPNPFSPNGDGHGDHARLTWAPDESGTARVSILDGSTVLRRVGGWRAVTAKRQTVKWDGKVERDGVLVPAGEGPCTLQVEMRDRAGNEAAARRGVVVDRTLGFPGVDPGTCSPNGDGKAEAVVLGFVLTRQADVLVQLVQDGSVLRTLRSETLGAGRHTLGWDGSGAGGSPVPSGFYGLRVTAEGSLGSTAVTEPVTVDCVRPKLSAPLKKSVARGATARVSYRVVDAFSPTVRVDVVAKDAKGRVVSQVRRGWVTQGKAHVVVWRPPSRGRFALVFRALDRGRNAQASPVTTLLIVR